MPYGELPEIETLGPDGKVNGKISAFPVKIEASATGPKTAFLRLPSNEELFTYLDTRKTMSKDLGRRMSESKDVPTPAADLKLFNAIRIHKSPDDTDWDASEALYAIGIITQHKILSCDRIGQNFVLKLATLFGETTHTVRLPWQIEREAYGRDVIAPRQLPYGVIEERYPAAVPVKLYDAIFVSVTGYTGAAFTDVPPHHKRTVVIEVLQSMSLSDPGIAPN